MTRSTFIQRLIALGGLPFLPTSLVTNYQKFYLLQCFVRGFRYYQGPQLLDNMHEGALLELVREHNNPYDECAIALHFNQQKIGFIPAESNEVLSKLLDIGIPELIAEITFLEAGAAEWEKVSIAVYVLKEVTNVPPTAAYLTQLDTPHYRTLKRDNDIVTKINLQKQVADDEEWDDSPDNYYDYLVEHSKDDSIYTHIHNHLDPTANYEEQVDYLVVNKHKLAHKPDLLQSLQKIESKLYQTEQMFNDDGYIVLSVKKAENYIEKINSLGNVTDKLGRKFIELEF